ncbi:AEC family transporter [Psychromonas sp. SR45-3]|uniref:AEC family transporter n=1 Tax=Psychromonas sp. SR45-3 TaxID=2760930 RepID=UPI0015F8B011|nr:AEC family transporter [Psychromonas sp. SR45-3]MBB1271329.1 AEC family transporter [Psychromonas sp. SR45-3]
MLLRIIEILFPMFVVVLAGYICARRTSIDMGPINKLNLDYFVPALVFASLVNMPLGSKQVNLIAASVIAVILPGLLIAMLCRFYHWNVKVWVPPHMFRNSGNLAIPLFVYTFGEIAKSDAVLLMIVSTCLQLTLGIVIISGINKQGFKQLLSMPIMYATVTALALNLFDVSIWEPVWEAANLLGESAIPLMLFSLGSQLIYVNRSGVKIGLISTLTSLVSGAITFAVIYLWIPLTQLQLQMMVLFTMLPPAVMNYLLAERYQLNGATVASMVLYGNLLSVLSMPLLLWFALTIL